MSVDERMEAVMDPAMQMTQMAHVPHGAIARVNGVALHRADEELSVAELRQRACSELLRQAAVREGVLPAVVRASGDGILDEAASAAIEALLERVLPAAEPDEAACRRYHASRQAHYREAERVRLRHILFAVTPGVPVDALRQRAEACLLALRCEPSGQQADLAFARAAGEWSNCPSGAQGGALGWLKAEECAPEFAREVFGQNEVGVLARLVHSRFGFHVVEVLERDPGRQRAFEEVAGAVRAELVRRHFAQGLRQYLSVLAGEAKLEHCALDAADSPLVQ